LPTDFKRLFYGGKLCVPITMRITKNVFYLVHTRTVIKGKAFVCHHQVLKAVLITQAEVTMKKYVDGQKYRDAKN